MSLIHEVSDIFQNQKFPRNWKTIELNKVLRIQNGFAFKSSDFNSDKVGMPLIRIRDIKNSTMETFYSGTVLEDFIVTVGDLLIGMDGDFNSNLWKGNPALLNQRVCRLIPDENFILKKFLYYGLPSYLNKINENTSSTTVKHLSSKSIGEIPFPLPPLAEQNRIVAKLDTLFDQLETIKFSMANIPLLLKDFRQQVLTQAVTGKLKSFNQSEFIKLNDLGIWKGGGTPSKANSSFWKNGTVLWTTPKDMKGLFLSDSMDKITESAITGSSAILIPKKSILIVTRSGILRRILPISCNTIETTVNQDLKVLIPNKKVYYKFLLYTLRGLEQDIRTTCMKSGTTVESIEFPLLKNYKINLPNFKEQQEIVSRVESLFAKADAIEQQYKSLKEKIDTLPQALLHKAFKGELTEQLDSDGDARDLLKQIQELKNSTVKPKKAKTKKVKNYPEEDGVLGLVAEGNIEYKL